MGAIVITVIILLAVGFAMLCMKIADVNEGIDKDDRE